MRFWCDAGTLLEVAVAIVLISSTIGYLNGRREREEPRTYYERLCQAFPIEQIRDDEHYQRLVKRIEEISNQQLGIPDWNRYLTALWIMKHHYDKNLTKV